MTFLIPVAYPYSTPGLPIGDVDALHGTRLMAKRKKYMTLFSRLVGYDNTRLTAESITVLILIVTIVWS